jgi:ribokinase
VAQKNPRLAVLGSLNMDITVDVDHLPAPGETILGGAARFAPGGKGANQAVAAARLLNQAGTVLMAGCVGDDAFGEQLTAALRAEGIDDTGLRHTRAASGIAMITVDATGENVITVAPGANAEVSDNELDFLITTRPDLLVISAEIPLGTVRDALAADTGATTLLNLAPAPQQAAALIAHGVDWLIVNETEAGAVLGHSVAGLDGSAKAAGELTALGPKNAVVTAGPAGAAMAGERGTETVPGFQVHAVDSVGAGDTFVGALAVALAQGVEPAEAIRAASAAGAAAATRPGAQSGMPRPADIESATGYRWPV